MSEYFYKTTRSDGRDFKTNTVDYGAALRCGTVLRHPTSTALFPMEYSTYFSVSSVAADSLISTFPHRLFRVEAVGPAVRIKHLLPSWYGVLALRVVEELEPHLALGPQGRELIEFLQRTRDLDGTDVLSIAAVFQRLGRPEAPDITPQIRYSPHYKASFVVMGGFGRMEPLDLTVIRRLVNAKPSYAAPQAGDDLDFRRSVAFRAMLYALQLKLATLPPILLHDVQAVTVRAGIALLYRDLITSEQYAALTEPWCMVVRGPHGGRE